jgi:hypothetical protein
VQAIRQAGGWVRYLNGNENARLNRTDVGDEGVRRLAGLGALEVLEVAETRVADAGLRAVGGPDTYYLDHRNKNLPSDPNALFLEYHRPPTR